MIMKKELTLISLAAMLATGANAMSLEERVKALEEKNEILSEELLKKDESGFTFAKADQSYNILDTDSTTGSSQT